MAERATVVPNITDARLNQSILLNAVNNALEVDQVSSKLNVERTGYKSSWGAVLIVAVTVLLSTTVNVILSNIILRTPKFRSVTYFYIVSMNIATTLHAILNFPSSVIFDFMAPSSSFDRGCIIWIYGETVFAHAIQLHHLGSSLDTYLRLSMPKWYGINNVRPATTQLKLAAPWIVSFLQTTAQVLLGDPQPPSQLENGRICTCPDVNFLILRISVAFMFPVSVTVIILFMATYKLKKSVLQTAEASGTAASRQIDFTSGSNNERILCIQNAQASELPGSVENSLETKISLQIPNGETKRDLCLSNLAAIASSGSSRLDLGILSHTTEDAELHPKMKQRESKTSQANQIAILSSTIDSTRNLSECLREKQTPQVFDHFCPKHGHFKVSLQSQPLIKCDEPPALETSFDVLNQEGDVLAVPVSQINSCAPIVNGQKFVYPDVCAITYPNRLQQEDDCPEPPQHMPPEQDHNGGMKQRPSRADGLSGSSELRIALSRRCELEKVAIKLNMIACATSIALWSPYMMSSLVYLLLTNTQFSHLVSISTLIQFKWLTYLSSLAYTIGYLIVDRQLSTAVTHFICSTKITLCSSTRCTTGTQNVFHCCRKK
ncbi:hypothetical protein CRM22_006186 [Opisthorchis felineus]|uniref:G-protein coupled receptors family 1 profile domain-containing protein n=1 Tax=Opisthorchis felineus TaxID=147828 RepID=A0A4S2LMB7_OPIFE|nr:hypothetical protein CRM22_006186 [Opisthorchis felineus]